MNKLKINNKLYSIQLSMDDRIKLLKEALLEREGFETYKHIVKGDTYFFTGTFDKKKQINQNKVIVPKIISVMGLCVILIFVTLTFGAFYQSFEVPNKIQDTLDHIDYLQQVILQKHLTPGLTKDEIYFVVKDLSTLNDIEGPETLDQKIRTSIIDRLYRVQEEK